LSFPVIQEFETWNVKARVYEKSN